MRRGADITNNTEARAFGRTGGVRAPGLITEPLSAKTQAHPCQGHTGGGASALPSFRKLRVLSLFAGIGGFDLGLERTGGFETAAFCEIEPFAQRVLNKHWPHVPCYSDVRELTSERLFADGISVDVICGGFPCQDISSAGERVGIAGERSGLWADYARLIGELRPRFVIVENVADLRHRGLGDVLGDLAALGYDAEWHCIPAAAVDAPHFRDRLWIVAYPNGGRLHSVGAHGEDGRTLPAQGLERFVRGGDSGESALAYADSQSLVGPAIARAQRNPWPAEPAVDRVANGVSRELVEPRLRALGNAVVPQIPELIGRAILQSFADPEKDTASQEPDAGGLAGSERPFHSATDSDGAPHDHG